MVALPARKGCGVSVPSEPRTGFALSHPFQAARITQLRLCRVAFPSQFPSRQLATLPLGAGLLDDFATAWGQFRARAFRILGTTGWQHVRRFVARPSLHA